MLQVVAAFAQLGDLQERSDRQQALASKAVEVDKSPGFAQCGNPRSHTFWLSLRLPQFIVASNAYQVFFFRFFFSSFHSV